MKKSEGQSQLSKEILMKNECIFWNSPTLKIQQKNEGQKECLLKLTQYKYRS